jgi:hypothetical protein
MPATQITTLIVAVFIRHLPLDAIVRLVGTISQNRLEGRSGESNTGDARVRATF